MLDLIFAKGASIRLSEGRESGHGFWVLETEDMRKIDRCWRRKIDRCWRWEGHVKLLGVGDGMET